MDEHGLDEALDDLIGAHYDASARRMIKAASEVNLSQSDDGCRKCEGEGGEILLKFEGRRVSYLARGCCHHSQEQASESFRQILAEALGNQGS